MIRPAERNRMRQRLGSAFSIYVREICDWEDATETDEEALGEARKNFKAYGSCDTPTEWAQWGLSDPDPEVIRAEKAVMAACDAVRGGHMDLTTRRGEMGKATEDGSNGYEAIANLYIAGRGTRPRVGDSVGAAVVRAWADEFRPGATVLDLGSGPGEPSTRILREAGLATYAVDASPTMVAAFRERFPSVPIERSTVESSEFFNRTFSGVLAWGLMFLLDPAAQALVIEKVARALEPQGRFLFTAPRQRVEWLDAMTGRRSHSLGERAYERLLRDAGLTWVADAQDEGENHYYFVEKA